VKQVAGWKEWQDRTVMTPRGPVFANKGDVVFVVVAEDSAKVLEFLASLDRKERGE
jgi:hypothetical protein